jgi:hypothetical protein
MQIGLHRPAPESQCLGGHREQREAVFRKR